MPPAEPFTAAELQQIAAEFPHLADRVYLNFASVGPLPVRARRAIDAINDTLQKLDSNFDPETDRAVQRARRALALLVGAREGEIGLVPNTSFGLNWAFGACALRAGDGLLITDHEFPALTYAAWHQRSFQVDVVVEPVPPASGLSPERLAAALQKHPHVRVVAVSWVNFYNGWRADLEGLAEVTHRHGAYLVVDAIQGVGTRPLEAERMGIDVLAAAAHKWLVCPVGQAFVWCHPERARQWVSPWAGWMAVDWGSQYSELLGHPKPFPGGARMAEAGTPNFAGVRALAETAEWMADLGVGHIQAHTDRLLDFLDARIDRERFAVVSDRSPEHRSSIYCLRPVRGDAEALRRHLARSGIVTALREGAVRLSPHFPTQRSGIEQLVQSLHEFH